MGTNYPATPVAQEMSLAGSMSPFSLGSVTCWILIGIVPKPPCAPGHEDLGHGPKWAWGPSGPWAQVAPGLNKSEELCEKLHLSIKW